MRRFASVVVFLLLGVNAYAQQKPAPPKTPEVSKTPPVADILTWISGHLEKTSRGSTGIPIPEYYPDQYSPPGDENGPNGDVEYTFSTTTPSISFVDCEVTLTFSDSVQVWTHDPDYTGPGYNPTYTTQIGTSIVGPFQLSSMSDKVSVLEQVAEGRPKPGDNRDTWPRKPLWVVRSTPIQQASYSTTMTFWNLVPATLTNFYIPFFTKDMADRQAKAWHDAIVACGGKAAPDNLY